MSAEVGRVGGFEILRQCVRVEEGAARLYRRLAVEHAAVPSLAALWEQTASDEDRHASELSLVLERSDPAFSLVVASPIKVQAALALIEESLRQIEQTPPSARTALEEAVTLERTLAQFHAEYAVEVSDPSWEAIFREMHEADQEHVTRLEKALRSLA